MAGTTGRDSRRLDRPAAPRAGAVEAAARVEAAGGSRSPIGVVLGTGLGGLAARLEDAWTIDAAATGWLPRSTATGHAGRLVCGRIGGRRIAALAGRVHAYEGFPSESLTRGVELLAALGATTVLLTNAAGGLRPGMACGELVVADDHVDLVRGPWCGALQGGMDARIGAEGEAEADSAGRACRDTAGPCRCYDDVLAEQALRATRRAGVAARRGVYAYLLGPSYETRAEYRMLRRFGADVVGMSTVPEAVAASRMGLRVAAVSVVTNVARPDSAIRTDAEDVCRVAAAAVAGVWAILEEVAADAPPAPPALTARTGGRSR